MQTILSSAPDAKYFPFGENRTVCIVPEWLLIDASCFGLFATSGSSVLQIASVDQIRTYPSVVQGANAQVSLRHRCSLPQAPGLPGAFRRANRESLTSSGRHEPTPIRRNIAAVYFEIFPLAYRPKERILATGPPHSSLLQICCIRCQPSFADLGEKSKKINTSMR